MYLIYNKETTQTHRIVRNGYWQDASYKTEAAAKAGLKRELRLGRIHNADEWATADVNTFSTSIEKTKIVKNLMSGKDVEIPVNTPLCCDPSSETYWSM